ncbi:MAG: ubiquinol-cytochrome c reductase cytochrome b subunit [Intrasporangium sp.]|uniref:cytochrome bc1 complex cytochrome b subunit n=1 Tax=Intrasporangium sp. TaxID=1925024 RepID=UPI002647D1E2|nr:ubiquinol-cytochrome c reductase cytochrome b subunit [Intrasporangium sp.]MDN5795066.1 ubiquinol-cytochrome c reductase cytochrome b subunit [Intrasporangium sp.]
MSTINEERPADALRAHDAAARRDHEETRPLGGIAGWVDDRTGGTKGVSTLMKKVFPDHWSFMLGEIAMYSMIICLLTGVFLTFWFIPSMTQSPYDGSYVPLQGVMVSDAYRSTLDISFDIRGGLLIRQIHHWAALIFVVAVFCHMARVFFTGAFRKPREINWVFGTILSLLACIEGFAGYSLPDDLLSGTGIRAMNGFVQSIPVIGSYMAYFIFGGAFPGELIIPRLYSLHILLVPAALVGLFTAHILLVFLQKHTQYPGPGRTNNNVVGYPFMPVYIAKAGGFFFIVFGVIALISAVVSINPIWGYGPYDPSPITAGSQPDWYMGFADGALRLLPGFLEFVAFGFTFSMNIFPGSILLLPIMWTIIGIYPFVEKWVTGDDREHHLLDRPRNAPARTGIGVAGIVLYSVLFFAAGNDLMAIKLHLSINDITNTLRVLFFIGPPIAYWITKRICLSMQQYDRDKVLHGRETGTIWRHANGEFEEIHAPLTPRERWHLVQQEVQEPFVVTETTDAHGVANPVARKDQWRAKLSHFYFKDRVDPVTPAELEAAHHAHGPALATEPTETEAAETEASEPAIERH